MGKKAVYKVKNWPEYNEALVKRGDITCWINPVVIEEWLNVAPSGKPGRPMTFSDATLEAMLALRSLFRLPLRSTEGLMRSIFAILDIRYPRYREADSNLRDPLETAGAFGYRSRSGYFRGAHPSTDRLHRVESHWGR